MGLAGDAKGVGAQRPDTLRRVGAGYERVGCVRIARDVMDRRFAEPLDLQELARVAGYSRFHFARSFRGAFGETPAAYLTRRRIERAKDLLRSANLTVTEVCVLVGFASLGSFSHRFRELVGCSPSQYSTRQAAIGGAPPVPGCFVMAWSRPQAGSPDCATSKKQEPPSSS